MTNFEPALATARAVKSRLIGTEAESVLADALLAMWEELKECREGSAKDG